MNRGRPHPDRSCRSSSTVELFTYSIYGRWGIYLGRWKQQQALATRSCFLFWRYCWQDPSIGTCRKNQVAVYLGSTYSTRITWYQPVTEHAFLRNTKQTVCEQPSWSWTPRHEYWALRPFYKVAMIFMCCQGQFLSFVAWRLKTCKCYVIVQHNRGPIHEHRISLHENM